MATMLVCGMEALVAARDACGLEPDEATEVMRWAAQALLQAARQQSGRVPSGADLRRRHVSTHYHVLVQMRPRANILLCDNL